MKLTDWIDAAAASTTHDARKLSPNEQEIWIAGALAAVEKLSARLEKAEALLRDCKHDMNTCDNLHLSVYDVDQYFSEQAKGTKEEK